MAERKRWMESVAKEVGGEECNHDDYNVEVITERQDRRPASRSPMDDA